MILQVHRQTLSPYVINHKLFLMQILQCEIISISTTEKSFRKLKQNTVQLLQVCLTLQIFFFFLAAPTAYKTLVPQPGIKPMPPALKGGVLTTREPRKFLAIFVYNVKWFLKRELTFQRYFLSDFYYRFEDILPFFSTNAHIFSHRPSHSMSDTVNHHPKKHTPDLFYNESQETQNVAL